jgi:hypothetical protein
LSFILDREAYLSCPFRKLGRFRSECSITLSLKINVVLFEMTGQPREFTGPGANLPWRPHDVTTGTKPPEQESEKTENTETKIEHGIPPH